MEENINNKKPQSDPDTELIEENLKRGLMEMLILQALSDRDLYGYEMTEFINSRSGGKLNIKEGSLYGPVYRLIDKGCLSENKVLVGKRRTRIYFHLEDPGRERLSALKQIYLRMTDGVMRLLKGEADDEQI